MVGRFRARLLLGLRQQAHPTVAAAGARRGAAPRRCLPARRPLSTTGCRCAAKDHDPAGLAAAAGRAGRVVEPPELSVFRERCGSAGIAPSMVEHVAQLWPHANLDAARLLAKAPTRRT
jgi:hypothetical protein